MCASSTQDENRTAPLESTELSESSSGCSDPGPRPFRSEVFKAVQARLEEMSAQAKEAAKALEIKAGSMDTKQENVSNTSTHKSATTKILMLLCIVIVVGLVVGLAFIVVQKYLTPTENRGEHDQVIGKFVAKLRQSIIEQYQLRNQTLSMAKPCKSEVSGHSVSLPDIDMRCSRNVSIGNELIKAKGFALTLMSNIQLINVTISSSFDTKLGQQLYTGQIKGLVECVEVSAKLSVPGDGKTRPTLLSVTHESITVESVEPSFIEAPPSLNQTEEAKVATILKQALSKCFETMQESLDVALEDLIEKSLNQMLSSSWSER